MTRLTLILTLTTIFLQHQSVKASIDQSNTHASKIDMIRMIETGDPVLVIFGADWCPESISVASIMNQIERLVGKLGVRSMLVQGADQDPGFRQELGIEEYPHIALFIDEVQIKFDGLANTVDEIVGFVKRKISSHCRRLESREELLKELANKSSLILFTGNKRTQKYKSVVESNHMTENQVYFFTEDKELIEALKIKKDNLYIFLNSKEALPAIFNGKWMPDDINKWVFNQLTPALTELTPQLLETLLSTKSPVLVLFLDSPTTTSTTPESSSSSISPIIAFLQEHSHIFRDDHYGIICYKSNPSCTSLASLSSYTPQYPCMTVFRWHDIDDIVISFDYRHDDVDDVSMMMWIDDVRYDRADVNVVNDDRCYRDSSAILKLIDFRGMIEGIGGSEDLFVVFVDDLSEESELVRGVQTRVLEVEERVKNAGFGDSIIFRMFNMNRNSIFTLKINKSETPFARFYRRNDPQRFKQFRMDQLSTTTSILNKIVDLASDDLPALDSLNEEDI